MENLNNIVAILEKSKYSTYITVLAYIIDSCNYNCYYCYNKKPRTYQKLDLDKLKIFIEKLHIQTNKCIKLELIGGEPTLHPDLINFCNQLKNIQWLEILVLTNLSCDNETINKYLYNNVILTSTYHYLNTDFIEKINKIDDYFFRSNKIEIRIMIENCKFFKSSIEILKYFIDSEYNKYVQCGLLSINEYNKKLYSNEELQIYEDLRKRINNFRTFYQVKYNDFTTKMLEFNDMFLNTSYSFKYWKCNAGLDYFYIHANGDIYPCETYYDQNINKKLGNINYLSNIQLKHTFCKCDFCTSCDFGIKKSKIFI